MKTFSVRKFFCAAFGSAAMMTGADAAETMSLFEDKVILSPHPVTFGDKEKWESVLTRHKGYGQPEFAAFMRELESERDMSVNRKAWVVNYFVNHALQEAEDKDLYGKLDYWATPGESLSRGKGDCEDHALLKYFALRALDVPVEKLYIASVGFGTTKDHVVLVVNVGDDFVILDNRHPDLRPARAKGEYAFYQALNQEGFWIPELRESFGVVTFAFVQDGDLNEINVHASDMNKFLVAFSEARLTGLQGAAFFEAVYESDKDNIAVYDLSVNGRLIFINGPEKDTRLRKKIP